MDDNIHMYESIVDYQERHKTDSEAVTHFGNKREYGSSRYEEPQSQWCAAGDTRTAVSNAEVERSSAADCCVQNDELKQIKKCLCVLSLLVAILLLMTLASLSLAAYTFYSTGSSASRSQALSAGVDKSTELVNHSFIVFKEHLTQEVIHIQENVSNISTSLNDRLEIYLNVTSQEIRQLENLITILDTRINGTNMQVENVETVTNKEIFQLQNLITTLDTRINDTNMQVDSTLVSLRNVVSMIEYRTNITGRDVANLRSTVNTRLNTINSEVVYQNNTTNAAVTDLQRQLNTYMANVSSLQIVLRSQPLIRLSRVEVKTTTTTLRVTFAKLDGVTFNQEGSKTMISTSPSSTITRGNILAYRPNYRDEFQSNLGTIFIHVEAVYPCATRYQQISCKLFPNEDDGFRGGRAIFEAMDSGGNFGVFSGITYAFAIEGCSQINNCYTVSSGITMTFTLVCLVPSSVCS